MKKYLKLIRITHWMKNVLIFLPLFFSKNLFALDKIYLSVIGFIVFSLIASCVYVINDINDIELDRKHPVKKSRPLASGEIKIKSAVSVVIAFLIISIGLSILLFSKNRSIAILIIPILYLFLNILYSMSLKNVPIVDVAILVSGFVLRVLYGALIIGVELSNWLLLMVMFGSFYLVFGKRRNEIIKNGNSSRKVLKMYNQEFLDKNMYVFLSLALISYSLWCLDPSTISRVGNNYLIWSVPILVMIFLKYSLDIEGNSFGDPIDVVTSDVSLIVLILTYIGYTTMIFYVL